MLYMLSCIVVPEYFALCAVQHKAYARELQRKVRMVQIARSDGIREVIIDCLRSLEQYRHSEFEEYLENKALSLRSHGRLRCANRL